MSVEDSDRSIHFDDTTTAITNEKGWRMSRANVFAREGSLYYEVKIIKGVPAEGPVIPSGQEAVPQPHIRMGWARREAPLDAPVGFDGYSYGITDIRFETMHRSRSAKIALPVLGKSKAKKSKVAQPPPPVHENDHVRTGDVIGLLITLPSLSLHNKVIDGIYNPAVDVSPGFDDPIAGAPDIIRDRIPVPYRGNIYFEQFEYQATKSIDTYSDRGPFNKVQPHPNHEDVVLRSLPHSSIKVFKNGKLIGTAFEKLLAFLPPSSVIPASTGARVGFDDGSLGYYPCVSSFSGGIAQTNFGPDFWFPPEELFPTAAPATAPAEAEGEAPAADADADVHMGGTVPGVVGAAEPSSSSLLDMSKPRGICDRYKEQVVEDVVWDIIDESDFFAQDGGYNFVPEKDEAGGGGKAVASARGLGLRDE
jgi:COMPASS component BRE2